MKIQISDQKMTKTLKATRTPFIEMESCLKKVTQNQTISFGCIQKSLLKKSLQGKNVNSLMTVRLPMIASKETLEIAG